MSRFSDPSEFMCGIYAVEFDSHMEASEFIERYVDCPVWPIVTQGVRENQAVPRIMNMMLSAGCFALEGWLG